MRTGTRYGCRGIATAVTIGLLPSGGVAIVSTDAEDVFKRKLARIDEALETNPNFVAQRALVAGRDRRMTAAYLDRVGQKVRADRSLDFCFSLLGISVDSIAPPPDPEAEAKRLAAESAAIRGQARQAIESAHALLPGTRRGLEIYRECAACHTPEGWGMKSGIVPQLAGQHRNVVIKQLADIRAGDRTNRVMAPHASVEAIGGAQAIGSKPSWTTPRASPRRRSSSRRRAGETRTSTRWAPRTSRPQVGT